jgi:hypothetical protein
MFQTPLEKPDFTSVEGKWREPNLIANNKEDGHGDDESCRDSQATDIVIQRQVLVENEISSQKSGVRGREKGMRWKSTDRQFHHESSFCSVSSSPRVVRQATRS